MAGAQFSTTAAIVVIIVAVVAFIFFAVNAWSWSKIYYNNVETTPISRSEAGWYFGISVLMAIIFLILAIYMIYVLATSKSTKVVPIMSYDTTSCASGTCAVSSNVNPLYSYT